MRLSFFLLFFILFGAVESFAEDKIITQKELNEEARNKFDEADNELNRLYKLIIKDMDEDEKNSPDPDSLHYIQERKKELIEAQNAWIKYRDLHCNTAASAYKGGSAFYLFKFSCLEEITEQRIIFLRNGYREELRKQGYEDREP